MYATQSDLERAFGRDELVDRCDLDRDGEPDAAVVEEALTAAAGIIDGYLAGRYPLPLPVVPNLLRVVACDVARARYWATGAAEHVSRGHERAIALLRDIQAGKISLPLPASPGADPVPAEGGSGGGSGVMVSAPPSVFGGSGWGFPGGRL